MNKQTNKIVKIALPIPKGYWYDYLVPENLEIKRGSIVKVPFGSRKLIGIVLGDGEGKVPFNKLKNIIESYDYTFEENEIKFIEWFSNYTLTPLGMAAELLLCSTNGYLPETKRQKKIKFTPPNPNFSHPQLNLEQQKAVETLNNNLNNYNVTLLDGITGSGKTETYLEIISKVIQNGKQVLVLVPEIGLTHEWQERFKSRFGSYPAVWHSEIGKADKREIWKGISKGEIKVLLGARSSLFLPFQNLGLIIVDEEHDSSYKQEEGIIYNARDMAIVRSKIKDIPLILASATPSLETINNVKTGKYNKVSLTKRYSGIELPQIEIVNLLIDKPQKSDLGTSWLSPKLEKEIEEYLSNKEQIMLFLNRRGYAPLKICRNCGHKITCPHCSGFLVEHKKSGTLRCHHCNYVIKNPNICPECGQIGELVSCGPGVERIEEEVNHKFPEAKTLILTSDSQDNLKDNLDKIKNKEIDIIIGTQILAKGHNFPSLSLVGVIDADIGLIGGDLRASERTFQLLWQTSGRAGRHKEQGKVIIQTCFPNNKSIKAISEYKKDAFIEEELAGRKSLMMPPFGRLAAIIISGSIEEEVVSFSKFLLKKFPFNQKGLEIMGPCPAALYKINNKYRYRLLIKTALEIMPQPIISKILNEIKIPGSLKIQVDIDPYNFL